MVYEVWKFHDVTPIHLQPYEKLKCAILSGYIHSGETMTC